MAFILDVKGVFDMNDFKSIQELLNELCSCIAVDENGNSFVRTKAGTGSSVNPKSDPEPGGYSSPEISDTNIT